MGIRNSIIIQATVAAGFFLSANIMINEIKKFTIYVLMKK